MSLLQREENMVGKEENAGHFALSSLTTMFSNAFFSLGSLNSGLCDKG